LSRAVQLRPARREHARRSLQRIDLEPRVLGERRQVRPLREVTGLRHRVLAAARPLLQLALLREPLEKLLRRKHELEREPGERLADLPRLAFVPSRNEELHRRSRSRSCDVELPGMSGTRTTRPPQHSTSSVPTIASRAQSSPFPSTSGRSSVIRRSGVGSSNITKRSTLPTAAWTPSPARS